MEVGGELGVQVVRGGVLGGRDDAVACAAVEGGGGGLVS